MTYQITIKRDGSQWAGYDVDGQRVSTGTLDECLKAAGGLSTFIDSGREPRQRLTALKKLRPVDEPGKPQSGSPMDAYEEEDVA